MVQSILKAKKDQLIHNDVLILSFVEDYTICLQYLHKGTNLAKSLFTILAYLPFDWCTCSWLLQQLLNINLRISKCRSFHLWLRAFAEWYCNPGTAIWEVSKVNNMSKNLILILFYQDMYGLKTSWFNASISFRVVLIFCFHKLLSLYIYRLFKDRKKNGHWYQSFRANGDRVL